MTYLMVLAISLALSLWYHKLPSLVDTCNMEDYVSIRT